MIPKDCRYTKDHEWIRPEGDTAVTGITEHAAEQMGDLTFVEPPQVGNELKAGDTAGCVESVKAVSDLYAPASGEVIEVNGTLADDPGRLNADPYGDGWLWKMHLSDPEELKDLMDADAYEAFLAAEEG